MNDQYKDIFAPDKGIAYYLNETDGDKGLAIFGSDDNISAFDFMAYNEIGDRFVTGICDNTTQLSKWIWQKYYDIWAKIMNALHIEYNPIEAGDYHKAEVVTHSEKTTDTDTGDTVNNVQAFNSDDFVNDKEELKSSNGEGTRDYTTEHDITETRNSEREKSTVIENEIKMRNRNSFYDIVLKDIKETICLSVY